MSGLVDKLGQIAEGWKNLVVEDKAIEALAMERARVCAGCEHNVANRCQLCGCFLPAKTRSPGSPCPDKRWAR